jgi:Flp pilus assembly protein TadD
MPPPPNPTHSAQVAPLLARAAELLRERRPGEAIEPLREAARWLPGNADIQHEAACCRRRGSSRSITRR